MEEKESRMKETMFIMGLRRTSFLLSHLITNVILFSIIAVISTIILGISIFKHSDKSLVFVYYWLFCMSVIPLTYMLSTFFNKAKLAGIVGPIIVFATVMPRFAFYTSSIDDPSVIGSIWITFMFSPTACAYGADVFMQYEGANLGLGWNNINENVLSMSSVLLGELMDFIIYAALALYFEQVIPNEVCAYVSLYLKSHIFLTNLHSVYYTQYGTHRKPWFIFYPLYGPIQSLIGRRSRSSVEIDTSEFPGQLQTRMLHADDIQAVEDPTLQSTITINKLTKLFTRGWFWRKRKQHTTAVNNLTMSIYSNQITALLGHNGAGMLSNLI